MDSLQKQFEKSLTISKKERYPDVYIYGTKAKHIAGGGDAEVFSVHLDNNLVAVKRYAIDARKEYQNELYFLNEFRGSSFIVQMLSNFEDKLYLYITMELCGLSVSKYLRQLSKDDKAIDPFVANRIIFCMFAGLDIIHIHEVIHGDIKPGNLIFDGDSIKIIDFCTAERVSFVKPKYVGTLLYTAPEILIESMYNTKADIWSAAISMFEVLTCELLFDAHNECNFEYGEQLPELSDESDSSEMDDEQKDDEEGELKDGVDDSVSDSASDSANNSSDQSDIDEDTEYKIIYRLLYLQEKLLGPPPSMFTFWAPRFYNSDGRLKDTPQTVYMCLREFINANFGEKAQRDYITADVIDILIKCLQFTHNDRPTAGQVLKSPYFQ